MKVTGFGAPRTLELRLKRCELAVWRAVVGDAHANELHHRDASKSGSRLRQLSRLLCEAHEPWQPDQPVHVVAPTCILAPLVRAAASTAIDRYVAMATAFGDDNSNVSADQVRAALDTTGAWTATLLALRRVEQDDAQEVDEA